jgi:putative flippase GtrA
MSTAEMGNAPVRSVPDAEPSVLSTVDRQGHPAASPETQANHQRLLYEFARFCLVGVLSTSVDVGVFASFRSRGIPPLLSNTFSFSLAVTNGFLWNRYWTFRAARNTKRVRQQYVPFFIVSAIGLMLNTMMLEIFAHTLEAAGTPTRSAEMIGKLAATPLVAVWNFAASKWWVFTAEASGAKSRGARAYQRTP